jgi:hypothetical protein
MLANKIPKLQAVIPFAMILIFGSSMIAPAHTAAVTGSDFNPANIIDNGIFFNKNTMNPGDIQNFLNAKVTNCQAGYTCLKNYAQSFNSVGADAYCGGITGGHKSAADIIFNVAQACGVNPQSLLVLLQKEQSLVTDTWPTDNQYRIATGYGCPDTAACDSQYYGFFNQVYNAGRQFKRYVQQPHLFNFAVGRTSFVQYNPNSACGGTNVTMQNGATAALYNYTPYQPNSAALANLYGIGNGCSAYGNRNFWRFFNDWFGPTSSGGYTVVVGPDSRQWLVFGSIKQHIPNAEIKRAWGFQDAVPSVEDAFLNAYATGPTLDRLYRINGGTIVYFVDGAKRYPIPSLEMLAAWNLNGLPISSIPPSLANSHSEPGYLSSAVKRASDPSLYMVDGANGSGQTILRQYLYPNTFTAWEGSNSQITTVSDDYFDQISQAVGSSLTSTKIAHGGNEYQVIAGQKMSQPANVAPLYPAVAQSVSTATFNRLRQTSNATHLVRASGSPEVYLLDNGLKHHILSADLLAAWTAQGYGLNIVNDGFVDLIPDGTSISSYAADVSGQLYIIDRNKTTVPGTFDTAYRNIGTEYSATTTLTNLFQTNSNQATGFIKPVVAPHIYLLDNSGKKRHFESADKVTLWGGYQAGISIFSDAVVNAISSAASPSASVSDGTTEYVMEAGTKVTVDSTAKTNWGLNSPQTYSDGTLNRFAGGGTLASELKDGSYYALIRSGKAFVTVDVNIANAWAVDTATARSKKLISALLPQNMLTRFVKPSDTGDNRVFVVDGGNWYNLSGNQRANLGNSNEPTMSLDPDNAPNTITNWTSVVVKDSSGKHYVIDGATKRSFAHPVIQNHWTGNGSLTVPTTTNGFLNLLPNNGTIERAIKGSDPAVYSAENGTKRWILSSTTFNQSYAPFAQTSNALINALPSGSSIP